MKTPIIEPYLFFHGRCEEALEFYETTLGSRRVMLMRFDEAPDPPPEGMLPPDWGARSCACQLPRRRLHDHDV